MELLSLVSLIEKVFVHVNGLICIITPVCPIRPFTTFVPLHFVLLRILNDALAEVNASNGVRCCFQVNNGVCPLAGCRCSGECALLAKEC